MLVQSLVCHLAPLQVFERWKKDYYREKLEWEAFRRFLSDVAMIERFALGDVAIWKDWLVYGTALGVGENVIKTMKSLSIDISETFHGFASFHSIKATAVFSGGFGGFGACGGFGGLGEGREGFRS